MTRSPAQARAVRIEEALVELLAALDGPTEAVERAARQARSALAQSLRAPSLASGLVVTPPSAGERHWRVGVQVRHGGLRVSHLHALMQRLGVPREAFVPPHRPDGRVLVGGYYRLGERQMARLRETVGVSSQTT